jgi:hypothetical protein
MRTVSQTKDDVGFVQTTSLNIPRTFADFMRKKYDDIPVNEDSIQVLLRNITTTLPHEANTALDGPITMAELHHAVQKGKSRKVPGGDGIYHEYFKATSDMIKIDMRIVVKQIRPAPG